MAPTSWSSTDTVIEGVAVLKRTSPPFLIALSVILAMNAWTFWQIKNHSFAHFEQLKKYIGPPAAVFSHWSVGVDQADVQWRDLVKNLPLLGPVLLIICLIARWIRASKGSNPALLSQHLINYYLVTGLLFVGYLHGAPFVFELALVLVNYFAIAPLSRILPFKLFMLVMWTCHVSILFINDRFKGYRFSMISESLRFADEVLPTGVLRWNVVFNMCTLRMIAYNCDFHEAFMHQHDLKNSRVEKHCASCVDCAALRSQSSAPVPLLTDASFHCYKLRTETPRPLGEYNLRGYLAYLFYVPLYVAGPMSSFNAFISHTHHATRSMNLRAGFIYTLRIVMLFVLLSIQLHFNFLNAIREDHEVFDSMPLSVKLGFFLFTLSFLWMKFNFLWKFFRLLGFIDGVESPEDMNRCFADTLTIQSFWKDWHSSFNLWIVRYMYIPMGGSKNRVLSIFPIFIFIAVWHDIELRLLWWALIMCICFIPEVVVSLFMAHPSLRWLRTKSYYRYIRALGGAMGMFVLIVANLVGYGTGTRNTGKGLAEIGDVVELVLATFVVLYSGAVIAVRDREHKDAEKKKLRALYGIKESRRDD